MSRTDTAIVSALHTVATRTWTPPTGQERDTVVAQLREFAGGRTDLVIQAAGMMLGLRTPDEHDPRHQQYTAGAALLLEVAGVREDDPAVQRWIPVGVSRRARWRKPRETGGIA